MNVGVVGNPNYHDLPGLLGSIARAAPRLGVKLFSEAQRRALTGVKRRQCLVRLFRVGMNF